MEKSLILERCTAALENMLRGQVIDRQDANQGRTVRDYNARTGKKVYSGNWCTGIFMACLLAMYKRTGNKMYLERAEFAGHYILSLQNMDARNKRYYGAYRECIPQSLETLPRDATTAAWCMVWLHEATRNPVYLDSAVLFAEWLMEHGMYDGWPHWAVFNDERGTNYFMRGSFQSGVGLFFNDLFLATGDPRYIERGLKPIAEIYVRDFFNEDGSIILQREAMSNAEPNRDSDEVELQMHNFNDDFGAQMLMAASDLLGDEKYRDQARKFALWLAEHQMDDGNFSNGTKTISSAVPISLMYFDELGRHYNDKILLAAAEKSFRKLLDMQLLETQDPLLHGAFEGMISSPEDNPRTIVQLRTNAYALIALLKVEGKIKDFWLGGEHNRKFVDPIHIYTKENPYPFKY